MSEKKKYSVRVRVWIDSEEGPFLGIGRVLLLQNIDETGSITNAAKRLKMSYRQAWQLVDDMNKRADEPLIVKQLGGKGGGGAFLTGAGKKMIEAFFGLENKAKAAIAEEAGKMEF